MIDTQTHIDTIISLTDDSFDINSIADYELFIELGPENLRLCIINAKNAACVCLEDYSFSSLMSDIPLLDSLTELYKQHSFLNQDHWKEVMILFNTPVFTLIPDDLFRKEYMANYLKLVRGKEVDDINQILTSTVGNIGAKNVFAIKKDLWEWLLNIYSFHTPHIKHQIDSVIDITFTQSKTSDKPVAVGLHFEGTTMTVAIVKENQLQLCNKFSFKVASDMVYYVLFILKNLNIEVGDADLKLYGEVTLYSDRYELLAKFMPYISFGRLPSNITFSDVFSDIPEHRYSNLLNTQE